MNNLIDQNVGEFSDEDNCMNLFEENLRDEDCKSSLIRLANLEIKKRNNIMTLQEFNMYKILKRQTLSYLAHALNIARRDVKDSS